MPLVRSTAEISKKWSTVTPQRADQYKTGVTSPLRDWASNAKAAEGNYNSGVQEAITKGRFGKGVDTAGTEKWKRKATDVGVTRWPAGVRAASPDYEKGFAPYRDTIEGTTLPPRYAKGDPRNFDRVVAMGSALRAKKVAS